MPFYKYIAIETGGARRAGELEAGTREIALNLLHKRGLVPLDVRDGAADVSQQALVLRAKQALSAIASRHRITSRQLVSLTRSLAALLNAGLTIDRALAIAASLETAPSAVQFFDDLAKAVRAGASFTKALGMTGLFLPAYYSSMVEAGELGGSLPQSLTRVSQLLQKSLDVRDRIRSALIYPIILACVVLGTLVMLIAFVLPRFQTLFEESEAPLPWSTHTVMVLGQFTSRYWPFIAAAAAVGLVAARGYLGSTNGRRRIHRWLLRSRLTFGLPAAMDTARMLRTLSTLLQSGVTLPSALRVSQGTLGNAYLRSALERVTQSVNAGGDFATSLASVRAFPTEAVQLARVGEETGRLHEMLSEAATILENDATRTLERLLALLVPAITIFMGLVVAGLIGSVLIGLLSLNDLAA